MKTIIIGIAGGSASGKTSIAQRIKKTFATNQSVVIIREDDYYKDQSSIPFEERTKVNYDHPLAFDHDLLLQHINDLFSNKPIKKPIYDFTKHTRSDHEETIYPTDVLVLEGLFVLENKNIRDLLDIKIFVDTEADIRFIRRLQRDVEKRGRTMESVIKQYTTTVKMMHDQFIEPSKKYAHLIVPEGGHNEVAIDILCTKIKDILSHNLKVKENLH